jgi:uncharacterized membrane-anchored protein
MDINEVFVTGYAKLPQGITAKELYSIIAVGLLVDEDTGIINDADCSLVTSVARNFVKRLLIGRNIEDLEEIEELFNQKYHGSARKALISAIRTCNEKYKQIKV